MKIEYKNPTPPEEYKCDYCGAHGVKLWREYQNPNTLLECAICCGISQSKDISNMDSEGRIESHGVKSDSIGWRIPAVPDEEGLGYWGYSSVPDAGVAWWKDLPNKSKD
jgi:hypothetical protein